MAARGGSRFFRVSNGHYDTQVLFATTIETKRVIRSRYVAVVPQLSSTRRGNGARRQIAPVHLARQEFENEAHLFPHSPASENSVNGNNYELFWYVHVPASTVCLCSGYLLCVKSKYLYSVHTFTANGGAHLDGTKRKKKQV